MGILILVCTILAVFGATREYKGGYGVGYSRDRPDTQPPTKRAK